MNKDKIVHRRHLSHIQPIGATFFVTCSLKGAIPQQKLKGAQEKYKKTMDLSLDHRNQDDPYLQTFSQNREYFLEMEDLLAEQEGPSYLNNPDIARILLARIESYHMRYYKLLAISIMPNYFHMLIDTSVQINSILEPDETPKNYIELDKIVNLIKGGSSRYINQLRNTTGEQVWENESYDIYMRDEKMVRNVMAYIADSPVKAGLVNHYTEHPFTILNME